MRSLSVDLARIISYSFFFFSFFFLLSTHYRTLPTSTVKMPPHGPGMAGAGHSHDPEFPDDDWNLYSMLDPQATTALNVTNPRDTIGIFKPHARRLTAEPMLISDADAQIIVVARFTSPVHIRKIMVIGSGVNEDLNHPSQLKCFVNREAIDFTNVEDINPDQQFNLAVNPQGTIEMITSLRPFTNVTSLVMFFPSNHGDVQETAIQYIGLQGEHTHYRREAVDAVYEVLCNGQDIKQPEDAKGAHGLHMH